MEQDTRDRFHNNEARLGNLEVFKTVTERRLDDADKNFEHEKDVRIRSSKAIHERITVIDEKLRGNGTPGLESRVKTLETAEAHREKESKDRRAERIAIWIAIATTIASSIVHLFK